MSEALLIALISFAVKYGVPAAIVFFRNLGPGPTLDDAINALDKAHKKSLEEYIRIDAEAAAAKLKAEVAVLKALTPLPAP
jgi:hypothetical protein